MNARLTPQALPGLPAGVARPGYQRHNLQPGIVHLGIGAFARAHLAAATEAAIEASGDLRWGIVGVSLRQPGTRDALAMQDGLYTLALRDADSGGRPRQRLQVIGCVRQLLVAPESPSAVLEAMTSPAAQIVSLTITEKGYLRDPASGGLWASHPDIEHDLANADVPRTAVGFIVRALQRRRQRGLGPLSLLSLDNLPGNGQMLARLVVEFAQRVDPDTADWAERHCRFPGSMVDRIVPRTTEADGAQVSGALATHDAWPVIAEPYFDWAVEDHFASDRPDWTVGGARWVEQVQPWETLKLRMVNGSHSAIAYLGTLAGWGTVDEAIAQPALGRFVRALMQQEIAPTLPPLPSLDVGDYCDRLLLRLANPALAHRTLQIAMDGSQKLPPRWLDTVRARLAQGQSVARLALAVAAWLQFLGGRDEQGRTLPLDDPLREALRALQERAANVTSIDEQARALLGFAPVFGAHEHSLALHDGFVQAVGRALQSLRARGVVATLEDWA